MDPTDLNDLSLLILCDVATTANGVRRHDRIATLLSGHQLGGGIVAKGVVPGCVAVLIDAGLLTLTRATAKKGEKPGWRVSITDKGREYHRDFIFHLRRSAAA